MTVPLNVFQIVLVSMRTIRRFTIKGLALYHRGDVDEAIEDLNEAIARDSARIRSKLLF